MNERVKEYIEEKQKKLDKKKKAKQAENLIKWGLYEKVYVDNENYDAANGDYEWNEEKQQNLLFNKVPIEVTDEEYQAILDVLDEDNKNEEEQNNKIATALTYIGVIIYCGGAILGLVYGNESTDYGTEFVFAIAIKYWITAFISGTVFLGFAEIIKLLEEIKNKLDKKTDDKNQ